MTSLQRRIVLTAGTATMVCALSAGAPVRAQSALPIRGAGATFPAPLYKAWIDAFAQVRPEWSFAYDAVGSGEGISRFVAGVVDFGASDAAMTDEQIAKVAGGVRMIPATAGLVAVIYNIPGLTAPLKLPRELLPAIFTGELTEWDDPRIAAANPGAALPSRTIAIVARLDSSGTTFALTNHLSALSEGWRSSHGVATRIDWPGRTMLMRGNEGVAGRVLQTEYSIGYAEFGFAQRLGLQMAELQNAAGAFVGPNTASGEAALVGSAAEMPENLRMFVGDPAGAGSYPIVTYSWLLLFASYPDPQRGDAVRQLVRWGLTEGQKLSADLGYIPLPEPVAARALAALDTVA